MTAPASDDVTGAAAHGASVHPGGTPAAPVSFAITTPGVSDTEVAAITVALLAATSVGPAGAPTAGPPAWRRAGLLEATTDRRVRAPAELDRRG